MNTHCRDVIRSAPTTLKVKGLKMKMEIARSNRLNKDEAFLRSTNNLCFEQK